MKKCPVCKTKFQKNKYKLCLKCGWDLLYYQKGTTAREEKIYLKKLQIAKRNWKALMASISKTKELEKKIENLTIKN